jgi:hypothetical protein
VIAIGDTASEFGLNLDTLVDGIISGVNNMSTAIETLNSHANAEGKVSTSYHYGNSDPYTESIVSTASSGATATVISSNSYISYFDGGYVESIAASLSHFDVGGYTGGGKYDVAGVVHGGEWVVPQEGSPVIRGDDQMTVEELKQIRKLMEKLVSMGIYNVSAVINTNDGGVTVRDMNPYDQVYSNL